MIDQTQLGKYVRIAIDINNNDLSPISQKIHQITNCWANDYINPVSDTISEIHHVYVDESRIGNSLCIGFFSCNKDVTPSIDDRELRLEALTDKYKLHNIHFNQIFGRNNILKNKTKAFFQEYVEIVSGLPLSAGTCTIDPEANTVESWSQLNLEYRYFKLFWNLFQDTLLKGCSNHSVFHIFFEQENNFTEETIQKFIVKYNSGLTAVLANTDKYISICKHPTYFTKKALFPSSVADLLVYGTNKFQDKRIRAVPLQKIVSDNNLHMIWSAIKAIFPNHDVRHIYQDKDNVF